MSDGRCSDCDEMALDRWASRCADCEIARQAERIAGLEAQLAQAQAELERRRTQQQIANDRETDLRQRAEQAEAQLAGLSQEAIAAAVAHCQAKSAWVRIQDDYRDGKITREQRQRLQAPNTKAWDESWAAWLAATANRLLVEAGRSE